MASTSHLDDKRQPSSHAYTAAEYERKSDHKANTQQDETSYVLALLTDTAHHKHMTALRKKYFPAHINKLEAHIALFRALPGSQLSRITQDLDDIASQRSKFEIVADKPFRLGHGIGVSVRRSEAEDVYEELKSRWGEFLSKQDQSFRAHYTIQNKVDSEEDVNRALEEVRKEFHQSKGTAEGLALYRYEKGYWKDRKDFKFQ